MRRASTLARTGGAGVAAGATVVEGTGVEREEGEEGEEEGTGVEREGEGGEEGTAVAGAVVVTVGGGMPRRQRSSDT